jgi:NAD(P)-dependent dehydrogenase (short-subunit alcohol dehydrogenase family)
MTADLKGKTALVTGATRGLGRVLALVLAEAGADVALLGRSADNAAATVVDIQALGRIGLPLVADVSNEPQMIAAAARAVAEFGKIDILVCAAGMGLPRAPVWETSAQAFSGCFDVNVLGVLLTLRAVLPHMIEQRSGRVVAIGGTYGHKGVAGFAAYAASKWALRGLMKSAALDAAPYGVTLNVIAPGGVDGERLRTQFERRAALNGEPAQAVLDRFLGETALGRLIEPSEIGALMLHLVGAGGDNITGQDFIVDAGTIL